jgi:ADP-ribose pyrophosphatase
MDTPLQPWKTLSVRTILPHSRFLTVEDHTVELPDGRTISEWHWLVTPDYVNVVAVTPGGQFLVFRQVKYGIRGDTLALVGGYIDSGEEPLSAARRELLEETGYAARTWTVLGEYRVDCNHGAGLAHFFLAQGAEPAAAPVTDDLEEQHLLLLERAEVEAALQDGDFKGLPWAGALALALLRLDKPGC